jgi:F420-dependent oxidoreductase-like protein
MKLGLSIGYSGAELRLPVDKVLLAERLGFDSVWTAEAYGSDAITPLAYLAALTKRIRLGTGIMQLAARPPASAAMAAGTVDALAGGGRVIAGLGVSGPQIVEGWYGQPWGKPYWRIRDYVAIMRKVFERKDPVAHAGREISLPYTGPGALGVGKPLTSILHMNPRLPIWLGTGTESNVKLTAEIADGWLPLGFVPRLMPMLRPWLEEGFHRAGGGKGYADFEIQPRAEVEITDDVRGALARMKPRVALYVGGMGHRDKNFSQGDDDSPRLRRRRPAHPGTVPREAEGRGRRRGARRILRRDGARGPGRAHPRTLPRLGRLRYHRTHDHGGAARGDGPDGGPRAMRANL